MTLRMLGAQALGFYSIPTMVFAFVFGSSKRFGTVMFPRVQEKYSSDCEIKSLEKYVKKPNEVLAYLLPVMLGFFYLFVPVLVKYVLPRYEEGVTAFKILMTGCFFMSLVPMCYNFMIAVDKQYKLVMIACFSILFTLIANTLGLKIFGRTIEVIAAATSISYFIFFSTLFFYVNRHFSGIKGFFSHLAKILLPFCVALVALVVIEIVVSIKNPIVDFLIKEMLFIVVFSPLLFYINKKTGIIFDIIGLMFSGQKKKLL